MTTLTQHGIPLLYDTAANAPAIRLQRLPLGHAELPESALQTLLASDPSVLPVDEMEAAFSPLILLGREIRTASGFIDLLFCSPDGYLTIVEVKLWKNPQARREVVGQILDYATDLSGWTFAELDTAVRSANRGTGVLDAVRAFDPGVVEEAILADRITRNLRLGRVLLLIVGDGIREGVERIADFLGTHTRLQYALALVELALYRLPDSNRLLIVPRTLARTVELARPLVDRLEDAASGRLHIPSSVPDPPAGQRRSLTETLFFEELQQSTDGDTAQAVRNVMQQLEAMGARPTWGLASSVTMRFPDPATGVPHTVVAFTPAGGFWLSYLESPVALGYSEAIPERYLGQVIRETGATRLPRVRGTSEMPVAALLACRDAFLNAAEAYITDLREAAGD